MLEKKSISKYQYPFFITFYIAILLLFDYIKMRDSLKFRDIFAILFKYEHTVLLCQRVSCETGTLYIINQPLD